MNRIVALALTTLFGAVLYAADKPATVSLKDADGKDVGTAKISDKGAGVKIALDLKGLPPGEHAVTFRFRMPTGLLYITLSAIGVGLLLWAILIFYKWRNAGVHSEEI